MKDSVKPSPLWRRHPGITLIVIGYLALATVFSVATPIFEASDEIWHYPYVKLIADGQGLPVQKPLPEDNVARQEGSQPPLYYALSALVTFWIDTGDSASPAWVNPHAKVGDPLAHGNKNMAIHTSRDSFPYGGPALAVHIIRWLSAMMGAVTVICVYATVRRVLPSRREIAIGAAALVAFNPEFAFISASVNNDNLITMLASLILLLLVTFMKNGIAFRQSLILGLALGLALLTKLTALGLIPIIIASVALVAYRRRSVVEFLANAGTILLVSAIVAGWWYVRNWQLYGDPTGLSMMLRIVGVRVPPPGLFDLLAEFEGFRISFWALFGAVNVIADGWIYKLLDGLVILAALGLASPLLSRFFRWVFFSEEGADGSPLPPVHLRAWQGAKDWLAATLEHSANPVHDGVLFLIPTVWLLIVFALFVRWTQTTLGSQGRLIFPALTGIAMLLSLGLASLAPRRLSWLPLALVGAFLLGFSALAPFRYIAPAYAAPRILADNDLPANLRMTNVDFGGKMRLIGYDLDKRQIKPGDRIKLTLYWQALSKMDDDYSIFIHFVGRESRAVAQDDFYPGLGSYPTRLWQPGEIIAEEHRLTVSSSAEAPALVRFVIGMYTLSGMKRLDAFDERKTPMGDAAGLAELKLSPATLIPGPARTVAGTNFSDTVELIGYELGESSIKSGDSLKLTLYWKARQKISTDYKVFAQLVSPEGQIYGQHDQEPVNGDYPTHMWDDGEVVVDEHIIPVLRDSPHGRYSLITGMYLPATNQRLTLAGSESKDFYTIAEIAVTSAD